MSAPTSKTKRRDAASPITQPTKLANGHQIRDRVGLTALLWARKPTRSGSQRPDWYLYDVEFGGEPIVTGSADAECTAARVLLARGITGKLTMLDGKTGKPRYVIDIEKAAKLTVREDSRRGPMFVKWRPFAANSLPAASRKAA
jgi:hypothetical protein